MEPWLVCHRRLYVSKNAQQGKSLGATKSCRSPRNREYSIVGLLNTFVAILLLLWLVGFMFLHVGGPLIHIIALLAVSIFVYSLLPARRAGWKRPIRRARR